MLNVVVFIILFLFHFFCYSQVSIVTSNETLCNGESANLAVQINIDNTLHSCGASGVHNQNLFYGSVVDQNGNIYKTIIINGAEWMAENLKVTTYRNGDLIVHTPNPAPWETPPGNRGQWCHYDNNSSNECPHGKLYNWFAVSDQRGICPAGWHVPSDAEFTSLINFVSSNGGSLKNNAFWLFPNVGATNSTGFSALGSGQRAPSGGVFSNLGDRAFYWTSTQSTTNPISSAVRIMLSNGNTSINKVTNTKPSGFSVRCVKD